MSSENLLPTLQRTLHVLSEKLSAEDFSLDVIAGPHEGQSLRLNQEITRIGRSQWCDLALEQDQWVSGEHLECTLESRGLRIKDLGSRNGISLGGHTVFDAYVTENSEFTIGTSTLRLRSNHQMQEISIPFHDKSGKLVGRSPAMRKLFAMLKRLEQHNVSTLLTGETGTGKTTVAEVLHTRSATPNAPFIVVNCGALPANLIEAMFFGHEKGAFTGAEKSQPGFFEQADGGTLFLDEIAELPLELQPKLLDVLERKKVRRIGARTEKEVEVRLITATHRDLQKAVSDGSFREDLYFRIAVVELTIPPLRARAEDIPLLVEALLTAIEPSKPIQVDDRAMRNLQEQVWPGNIRQLRNTLLRSITFLEGDTIHIDDLVLPYTDAPNIPLPKPRMQASTHSTQHTEGADGIFAKGLYPIADHHPPFDLKAFLTQAEKELIVQALDEADQNVQQASRLLGITAAWLYNRIKKYDLNPKAKRQS